MIDKRGKEYYPCCDGCGEELEPCDNWQDAKDSMESAGWVYNRQYESNLCTTCQEEVK